MGSIVYTGRITWNFSAPAVKIGATVAEILGLLPFIVYFVRIAVADGTPGGLIFSAQAAVQLPAWRYYGPVPLFHRYFVFAAEGLSSSPMLLALAPALLVGLTFIAVLIDQRTGGAEQ